MSTKEPINMKDKYTSGGRPFKVLCVDAPGEYPVKGYYEDTGNTTEFTSNGCFYSGIGRLSQYGLIKVSPFADFKKGDPVMVKNRPDEFELRRHFSHEKDGKAVCFAEGSEWTSHGVATPWPFCRHPTKEELES
jgi:hypothetical protein